MKIYKASVFQIDNTVGIWVEFSLLFVITHSIAPASLSGLILRFRFDDIASSNLINQSVLSVKLQKIFGCVLFVVITVVAAERFDDCFEIGNAVEPSATSDESINGKTLLPAESSSKNSGKGATTSIPRSH
ncbi:hypothetical protein ACH5RR_008506 [Cinchona calisaya]|uniref:Uncharacterized protein n=1 Tax=Cinchona calisaya TaxID=153742 RepID=A0ABD3ABS8_9GENT